MRLKPLYAYTSVAFYHYPLWYFLLHLWENLQCIATIWRLWFFSSFFAQCIALCDAFWSYFTRSLCGKIMMILVSCLCFLLCPGSDIIALWSIFCYYFVRKSSDCIVTYKIDILYESSASSSIFSSMYINWCASRYPLLIVSGYLSRKSLLKILCTLLIWTPAKSSDYIVCM